MTNTALVTIAILVAALIAVSIWAWLTMKAAAPAAKSPDHSRNHGPTRSQLNPELSPTQLTPQMLSQLSVAENELRQRYVDKLNQIDQERITALLVQLSDLNRELGLADTQLTVQRPEIETPTDPAAAILLMTHKRLAGHGSVRQLEAAFEQHNSAAEAAGQRKLRITQKQIRQTLQEYTSGKDGAIKLIRLNDSGQSKLFFLFYANGRDRYLIPLDDMVESWATLNRVKNPSTVL